MKKFRLLALVLAVFMVTAILSSCTKKDGGRSDDGKDEKTVKIGGIAPTGGEVAVYGIATNNGVMMAIEEVNKAGGVLGKQIEYIHYNDEGDSTEAMNVYNKLVDRDKVRAIIGPVTSGPTNTVAGHASKAGVPMITATGTSDGITLNRASVFRACFTDSFQGEKMAEYAKEVLSLKKVAILFNNSDDYSRGLKEAFEKKAKEIGLEIAISESYTDAGKLNTHMTNIKHSEPDGLFIPTYYEDVASAVRLAKDMNVKLLGGDGWDGVVGQLGEDVALAEGAYYCSQYSPQSDDPALQKFLSDYKAKYNTDANQFAVLGYDAAKIMIQAIKDADSLSSEKIVSALKNISYTGLTGEIKYDANNNPIKKAAIITIADGKDVFKEYY